MATKKLSDRKPAGFFVAHLPSGTWALAIFILCILPGDALLNIDFWTIDWEDKAAHLGVFGLLGLLMVWGEWRRKGILNPRPAVKVMIVVLCLLFGMLIEIIQNEFIPTRYGSAGDAIADFLGALLGTLLAPYALRLVKKIRQ